MAYATVDELVRRLGLSSPSAEQLETAQGCLDAGTFDIDSHMGWLETPPTLTDEQLALVKIVNLDVAGEHWRYTPYGALNQGPDLPPVLTARDSWYRHARKLARLKTSWGVA
jgi:hypothetical protein